MPPTLLLECVNYHHIELIQKKLFIDGTRSSNLEHAVLPYPLVDEEAARLSKTQTPGPMQPHVLPYMDDSNLCANAFLISIIFSP